MNKYLQLLCLPLIILVTLIITFIASVIEYVKLPIWQECWETIKEGCQMVKENFK